MYRVMYKDAYQYVADRDGVFYYVRRVPHDVKQHYASSRISFSLRTKSHQSALRAARSVTQRLEDYWLGLRLQQMDIPAIHLMKTDDVEHIRSDNERNQLIVCKFCWSNRLSNPSRGISAGAGPRV